MDEAQKKRLRLFLGSLFVAVIFLSGVAAFGNNNAPTYSSTTTISKARTIPVFGASNAIVIGYGPYATVKAASADQNTITALNATLAALEKNGSINNYYSPSAAAFQIYMGTMNAYGLQQRLYKSLNTTNAISVNATTYVLMPQNLVIYYNSQPFPIRLSQLNYSVSMSPLRRNGTMVSVSVRALLAANGSVYNNQIIITPR